MRWAPFGMSLVVLAFALSLVPVSAQPSDWDIPQGHFYTQTGPGDGRGYAITDDGGVLFWTWFQLLGGVDALGYPMSQRFVWDGFVVQATQRVVLQWRPEIGQVYFVNVFDELSKHGFDGWLLAFRQTPPPIQLDESGMTWDQIVAGRLSLLDANPAIRAVYNSVFGDPVTMNGLPTSRVEDMGNHYALRAQRVAFQQWKEDVPWAKTGEVTVALGGAIAAEAGLLPAEALVPQAPPTPGLPQPTPPSGTPVATATPAPGPSPTPPAPAPTPPSGGTQVFIQPSNATVSLGESVVLDLRIENVSNLYGAQVSLTFNPSLLQGVDSDPSRPGVQMEPGSFLPVEQGFLVRNEVDNTQGRAEYALTLLAPAEPVSGSGVLARLTLQGVGVGTSPVAFSEAKLVGVPGPVTIPVSVAGGTVIVR